MSEKCQRAFRPDCRRPRFEALKACLPHPRFREDMPSTSLSRRHQRLHHRRRTRTIKRPALRDRPTISTSSSPTGRSHAVERRHADVSPFHSRYKCLGRERHASVSTGRDCAVRSVKCRETGAAAGSSEWAGRYPPGERRFHAHTEMSRATGAASPKCPRRRSLGSGGIRQDRRCSTSDGVRSARF